MKENRILYALGGVDDKYIEEAAPDRIVRRRFGRRGAVVLAACLCLLIAMSAVAYAANWMGLRDLILPIITNTSMEKSDTISLNGYSGSPEWLAQSEWQIYINQHQDIFEKPDRLDTGLERYSCYRIYSKAMADKIEEIAGKYGLKLHTSAFDLQKHTELAEALGDFMSGNCYYSYMYEDGTFQAEGVIDFEDIGAWDFRLLRSVKGTFHDAMLDIGKASDYEEKLYKTACGAEVNLALGKNKVVVLADLSDSFVTVHIPYGADDGFTWSHLEKLADSIDFSRLTPVISPKTAADVQSDDMKKTYTAVLHNLLHNNILPDGKKNDLAIGSDTKFAIEDVDTDGKEELVLLCDSSVMSNMAGYIIGYNEESKKIYTQLIEFPYFEFLQNGNLKAFSSHNQTWGEMWPYSLYQYIPEDDTYSFVGYVYSEDKKIFELNGVAEKYPDSADISRTGTVYYIDIGNQETAPIDEAEYLIWLEENKGNCEKMEIEYLALTEENISLIMQ